VLLRIDLESTRRLRSRGQKGPVMKQTYDAIVVGSGVIGSAVG
jgi:hypothetical protein